MNTDKQMEMLIRMLNKDFITVLEIDGNINECEFGYIKGKYLEAEFNLKCVNDDGEIVDKKLFIDNFLSFTSGKRIISEFMGIVAQAYPNVTLK